MYHKVISRSLWSTLVRPTQCRQYSKVNSDTLEFLRRTLGEGNYSVSRSSLELHGKDEGHFSCCPPDAVVWPKSTDEVSKILAWCNYRKIPVTPYGTGTGLEGGVNATEGGICVALEKMTEVIEVNETDFDCLVEAGVTWRSLNETLRATGLWFTVDPGASASLGGMVSTSASGTNAVRYGTMKENVLNLEVVLPNGDVVNTSGELTHTRKSSAGYDLTSLFLGSEGTLGVVTKIRLKLHPLPEKVSSVVCSFPSDAEAMDAALATLQSGILVAKIEYVDKASIIASNNYNNSDFPHFPALFVEIHGDAVETFVDIARSNGCVSHDHASTTEERNRLWKIRHELFYAIRAQNANSRILVTDVCVPLSKVKDMVIWAHNALHEMKLEGVILGHIGDGNFHVLLPSSVDDDEEERKTHDFGYKLGRAAIQLGGTCTGEHGIGRGKRQLMKQQYSPEALQLMRSIKQTIDPNNIMNPNKVV